MDQVRSISEVVSAETEHRLRAFRRDVEAALPGEVVDMRLFGSRARGDAHDESDYDIAVFLRFEKSETDARSILSDLAFSHRLEGYFISAIELPADYLAPKNRKRTELAAEISRDGLRIE